MKRLYPWVTDFLEAVLPMGMVIDESGHSLPPDQIMALHNTQHQVHVYELLTRLVEFSVKSESTEGPAEDLTNVPSNSVKEPVIVACNIKRNRCP